jgi:hypothetical protein
VTVTGCPSEPRTSDGLLSAVPASSFMSRCARAKSPRCIASATRSRPMAANGFRRFVGGRLFLGVGHVKCCTLLFLLLHTICQI